jgi:DNA repair exonuclease SbcCD nuclease subunit
LNKLEYLASIASGYHCKTFILLGDVFDSPVTSLPYLATVINTFKKISDQGITVYTIAGNHDLKNNRMDSLPSTALGILISTNFVKLAPRELPIDSTMFKCYNYPENIDKKSSDNYEVCIAHRYYEFMDAHDSLNESDVINLNYDSMVLGHYHAPCDTRIIGNTTLYMPGSLSRCTSEAYNKLRTPRVLIFNCIRHNAIYTEIPCGSADEIFVQSNDVKNAATFSMKDLIQFITTSYASSDMNVRDYFNSIEIPYDCRVKIAKYLDDIGA